MFLFLFILLMSCVGTFMILDVIKTARVSMKRKILAFFVDLIHNVIAFASIPVFIYIVFLIVFQNTYNIVLLLLIILIELVITVLFFKYNMCILSIIFNKILDIHPCTPYVGILERYKYYDIINKFTKQNECIRNKESFICLRLYIYIILIALVIIYILSYIGLSNKFFEITIIGTVVYLYVIRKHRRIEHFHLIKTPSRYLIMPVEIYDNLEFSDDNFMMERQSIWFRERLTTEPTLDYQSAVDEQFNIDIEPVDVSDEDSNYVIVSNQYYEIVHIDDSHEEYDIVIVQRPGKMYGVAIKVDKDGKVKRWLNPVVMGFIPDDKINILVDNGKHLEFSRPIAI